MSDVAFPVTQWDASAVDYTRLQKRITTAREACGTQEDVAAAMRKHGGANLRTLQRWESGETPPSVEKLFVFCLVTGVSSDWLLGLSDSEEIPPEAYGSANSFGLRLRTNHERERQGHEPNQTPVADVEPSPPSGAPSRQRRRAG